MVITLIVCKRPHPPHEILVAFTGNRVQNTGMDDKWINDILQKNKNKSFVKRILRTDNYKPLDNGDGTTSTHSMAYGNADGKYYVYPTVMMTRDGSLKRFSDDEAWSAAHEKGNVIEFDDEAQAKFFSKNYKRAWDKKP